MYTDLGTIRLNRKHRCSNLPVVGAAAVVVAPSSPVNVGLDAAAEEPNPLNPPKPVEVVVAAIKSKSLHQVKRFIMSFVAETDLRIYLSSSLL